jgi:hypothetical protein
LIVEYDKKLRVVHEVCRSASVCCARGCSPRRNCVKLLAFIKSGRLEELGDDPATTFFHWSEDVQREYDEAVRGLQGKKDPPVAVEG